MIAVRTPAGEIALIGDRLATCPWCKNERVFLCREAAKSQWIPVIPQDDWNAVHELHRCPEALARNGRLRYHLQMRHSYDEPVLPPEFEDV